MPIPAGPVLAFFDADGVCQMVTHGSTAAIVPPSFPYEALIEPGHEVNALWFDIAAGTAEVSEAVDVGETLGLPPVFPVDTALSVTVPANCVAIAEGQRYVGSFTIPAGASRPLTVDLRGAKTGTHYMVSETQAATEAAGSVQDQLAEIRSTLVGLAARIETLERKGIT